MQIRRKTSALVPPEVGDMSLTFIELPQTGSYAHVYIASQGQWPEPSRKLTHIIFQKTLYIFNTIFSHHRLPRRRNCRRSCRCWADWASSSSCLPPSPRSSSRTWCSRMWALRSPGPRQPQWEQPDMFPGPFSTVHWHTRRECLCFL